MAKKVDPLKAKQKRQKMIAIGGAVLLVALIAFQAPRVMKQLNKKAPVSSAPVSTTPAAPTTGTPSLAAPTLRGAEQPSTTTAAPVSGDGVTTGDVAPPVQTGQLASFSRFASKDPFAQQLSDDSSTAPSSSGAPASGGSSSGGSSTPSGSSAGGVPTTSGGGGAPPAPGGAVISVNGVLMSVTTGTDFPAANPNDPSVQPLFHLVSLSAHSAKIAIVGGSYANGAPTVTLRENKPITLMNTADGTRYRLILKPQGTPVPAAAPAPAATTTTPGTTPGG